jgi:hypothetical protein
MRLRLHARYLITEIIFVLQPSTLDKVTPGAIVYFIAGHNVRVEVAYNIHDSIDQFELIFLILNLYGDLFGHLGSNTIFLG